MTDDTDSERKNMGNFLCKIGWHKWRKLLGTFGNLLFPVPIEQCHRCGLKRVWVTPEAAIEFREPNEK